MNEFDRLISFSGNKIVLKQQLKVVEELNLCQ